VALVSSFVVIIICALTLVASYIMFLSVGGKTDSKVSAVEGEVEET